MMEEKGTTTWYDRFDGYDRFDEFDCATLTVD